MSNHFAEENAILEFFDFIPAQNAGEFEGQTLFGTNRHDNIFGSGGNDRLFGLDGFDNLYGKAGSDVLKGGRWS